MVKRSKRDKKSGKARGGREKPHRPDTRLDFDLLFPILYASLYFAICISIHMAYFPVGDTGVETDFYGELVVAAQKLWQGDFSTANYPYKGPFYSFALILVHLLGTDWYLSGVLLNIICAVCSIFVLYRLLLRLFNRSVAVVTAVSVSLVSEFFVVAHKASSDMLFFLLCFLVITMLVLEKLTWPRLAAAGVLSSFAFLTRYNGVFLPASALIVLLLINPERKALRRRLLTAVIYLAVFLAVCSPWFVKNYRETGILLKTRNLENIEQEFYGGDRSIYLPEGGFKSVREVIFKDPVYFVTHYMTNIPSHFWQDMENTLGLAAGILVILGLIRMLLIPPTRRHWAFFVFSAVYFLIMSAIFFLRRLSLPLTPAYYAVGFSFLFGSGAGGRSRLGSTFENTFARPLRMLGIGRKQSGDPGGAKKDTRRYTAVKNGGGFLSRRLTPANVIIVLAIAALLIVQVTRIVKFEIMYYNRRPMYIPAAGRFLMRPSLRASPDDRPVIMARKPHIAYYSNMQFQHYPQLIMSLYDFIAFALDRNVDFIVYSDIEKEHYKAPRFKNWLESMPGMQKIYEVPQIAVYRVSGWLNLDRKEGKDVVAATLSDLRDAEERKDSNTLISICYELSRLFMVNKKWDEAAEYLSKALETARLLPDAPMHLGSLRFLLAKVHLNLGRHNEGIALLNEEIALFESLDQKEALAGIHILTSKHYEALGRKDQAIEHLQRAHDIYLSLESQEQADFVKKEIERVRIK